MSDETPKRQLIQGDIVEIRHAGRFVRIGRIDDLIPGSGIIWLMQDGNERRKIFDAADGYEILLQ